MGGVSHYSRRVITLYRAPWSTNVERVALALAFKGLGEDLVEPAGVIIGGLHVVHEEGVERADNCFDLCHGGVHFRAHHHRA